MSVNNESKIVFISCLLLVVGLAAVDFFNPSLPYIINDLHTNQAQVKGLIVVYMVVLGVAQFFYGSFSDRRGRRPAVILSFGIAAVGLGASAFAKNIDTLYFTRALTAFGTAGCTVISRAVIVDSVSDGQRIRKAFSWFAMSSQVSPAFAPLIGGSIQQYFGWRWSFATMMLIMISAWFFLLVYMPETHEKESTDFSLASFFSPYPKLMRDIHFSLYSLASALIFVFTIGYYSTSPYAFHALNYSAIENGLFYLSYSIAILLGSWAMGSLFIKFPADVLYNVTVLYFCVVCTAFIVSGGVNSLLSVLLFSFLIGFGCGVSAPLALVLSMTGVEQQRGAASALQGAVKMFFTGVFMLSFYFTKINNFNDLLYVFLGLSLLLLFISVGVRLI